MLVVLTLAQGTLEQARERFLADSIAFTFQHRHETERIEVLDESGAVRPEALRELSHFVRCWRTKREKPMHPRLVEIVARVAQHFDVDEVQVISGYRARPYGAPRSKHFLGHAMDLQVPGVPPRRVARWVWRNFRQIGVGYYPAQRFVHIDVREDGDVRWIDRSGDGESHQVRYFMRQADDELPAGAPRLAHDETRRTLELAGVRM